MGFVYLLLKFVELAVGFYLLVFLSIGSFRITGKFSRVTFTILGFCIAYSLVEVFCFGASYRALIFWLGAIILTPFLRVFLVQEL